MDKDAYQKRRDVLFGHCVISSMLRSNGGGTYFDQTLEELEEFESLQKEIDEEKRVSPLNSKRGTGWQSWMKNE